MKTRILPVVLLAGLLAACGEDKTATSQPPATSANTAGTAAPALPADAPAVGTPIADVAKSAEGDKPKQDGEFTEIEWENLELPGQGLADIIKKYQPQIDAIPEGDPAEDAVLEKMQAELNSAPVNPELNGKKIKIPGFISPLEVDEAKGMVKEFLLVPYFGACIHVPPPPLNQTLLVKPQEGKSIGMERMYEPVWVFGTLSTDFAHTDLADAGYQINDAKVEIYQDDEGQQ
ncbi:MAG: DUF3299 domain-containing protein [Gammaproteobacteria bacterium]|nr:DUF3299 domain-containing protein [Gammaproteobacteria bacterium]MBU1725699.1 DUF3299 domain-containing protein [Gammaproteobacteria bacterium]MBU2003949.1 DUF3299 domain-containing protein [Gammaproteobacteria bacterium]